MRTRGLSLTVLVGVLTCCNAAPQQPIIMRGATGFIWPISGSAVSPDLPQSSPFGPRQKASEGFRYDWHRGVDIPTPVGTSCLSVSPYNCTVNKSGADPNYEDLLVQLRCSVNGTILYINYLHMNTCSVAVGETIMPGQIVGLSGVSISGFAHLHFEIREGGLYQKNCVNPWKYLPYTDTVDSHTAGIGDQVSCGPNEMNVTLSASQSANELDLNLIELRLLDSSGGVVYSKGIDFDALTLATDNAIDLDNPLQDGILIQPSDFNPDHTSADYNFIFINVTIPPTARFIQSSALDLSGHRVSVQNEIETSWVQSSSTSQSSPFPLTPVVLLLLLSQVFLGTL
ncbi:M23 family metallopeptidase [Pelomyxa schiedti]|nr:M23 family metallopeptidase [Pelomyxa schiedti]